MAASWFFRIESVCDKKLPKSSILQNLILNLFLANFSYV